MAMAKNTAVEKKKLHGKAEETATRVTMSTQKTSRRQAR
jgi:hypothetical protein